MKTAAVLRLPACRDLSRQTRVSTSNYSALTTGLVRPRNAINYLQKRFPSPKWENSPSGTLCAKWLQKKWEWSSTTMNTESSNGFSSRTNKRGNYSFNHVRAAFGLLDPYNAESFGDYTVWGTQRRGKAPLSRGSFEREMWENADVSFSSLPAAQAAPPPHSHRRLSPSLNLSLVLIYIMDGSFSLQDRVNT